MRLDRLLREEQRLGDAAVGQPVGGKFGDPTAARASAIARPGRDDFLAGASTGERPALQALLLDDLFERRRHFTVRGERQNNLHTLPAIPGITGTRSVSIATRWELRFTRLAYKPAGLDPPKTPGRLP